MHEYLLQLKNITNMLVAVSSPIDEEDMVLHILNGLSAEFNSIKTAIKTRPQAISLPELQDLLIIKDQQICLPALVMSFNNNVLSFAFITKQMSNNDGGGGSNHSGWSRGKGRY